MEEMFRQEALITARLEHPNIVPVYDLGVRADGAAYFTMKRVRGLTLQDIIAGLRRGDLEVEGRYSRRKLLSAFSQVCLTVAFSHSRGVVHRDVDRMTVEAVEQAAARLVPVRVGVGRGHEDRIMENRRLIMKDGREIDVRHAYSMPPDDQRQPSSAERRMLMQQTLESRY